MGKRRNRGAKKRADIIVHKRTDLGAHAVPVFVDLAQRHLEKSPPPLKPGVVATLIPIPVDLLRVGDVFPPALVDSIESVSLVYEKRS